MYKNDDTDRQKTAALLSTLADRQRREVLKSYTSGSINNLTETQVVVHARGGDTTHSTTPIKDGDVAETGPFDDAGYNSDPQWWIRINGRWVNTLGGCEDEDASTQPIYGTEPRGGHASCLAKIDHVHGVPHDFTNSDSTCWPEGTIVFIGHKGWVRSDDMFICFTHLELPLRIDSTGGLESV